jgi:hypothetical protein
MTNKNEVVAKEQGYLVDNKMTEIITKEFKGLPLTLAKIKIPSGGGLAFEIPSADPENPDLEKSFEAVIAVHRPINVYYKEKYTGEIVAPDCYAADAENGIIRETGEITKCADCPLNQYGSGEGGVGKACQNKHVLFLVREGEYLPTILTLPSTSLKPFTVYMRQLLTKGKVVSDVVTKFSLKREKNKSGIEYSEAVFSAIRALTDEEKKSLGNITESLENKSIEIL